jgi:hypothetical protein
MSADQLRVEQLDKQLTRIGAWHVFINAVCRIANANIQRVVSADSDFKAPTISTI